MHPSVVGRLLEARAEFEGTDEVPVRQFECQNRIQERDKPLLRRSLGPERWRATRSTLSRRAAILAAQSAPRSPSRLPKARNSVPLPLPRYSPDFNPIEQAFAILKRQRQLSGRERGELISRHS